VPPAKSTVPPANVESVGLIGLSITAIRDSLVAIVCVITESVILVLIITTNNIGVKFAFIIQ